MHKLIARLMRSRGLRARMARPLRGFKKEALGSIGSRIVAMFILWWQWLFHVDDVYYYDGDGQEPKCGPES